MILKLLIIFKIIITNTLILQFFKINEKEKRKNILLTKDVPN